MWTDEKSVVIPVVVRAVGKERTTIMLGASDLLVVRVLDVILVEAPVSPGVCHLKTDHESTVGWGEVAIGCLVDLQIAHPAVRVRVPAILLISLERSARM